MKRDLDLILAILREVEDRSKTDLPGKWTDQQIGYHQALLIEAGLLRGSVHRFDGEVQLRVEDLTWSGHEFLAATSSAGLWQTLRERLRKIGGEVAFDIILELAKAIARQQLGLPPA